jgi:hypothetical protein
MKNPLKGSSILCCQFPAVGVSECYNYTIRRKQTYLKYCVCLFLLHSSISTMCMTKHMTQEITPMQVLHTIQSYLHSQLIHQIVQSTNTKWERELKLVTNNYKPKKIKKLKN